MHSLRSSLCDNISILILSKKNDNFLYIMETIELEFPIFHTIIMEC